MPVTEKTTAMSSEARKERLSRQGVPANPFLNVTAQKSISSPAPSTPSEKAAGWFGSARSTHAQMETPTPKTPSIAT